MSKGPVIHGRPFRNVEERAALPSQNSKIGAIATGVS